MKKRSLHEIVQDQKEEIARIKSLHHIDYNRLLVEEAKVKVYERVSMGHFVEEASRAISTLTDALAHTLQSVQKGEKR